MGNHEKNLNDFLDTNKKISNDFFNLINKINFINVIDSVIIDEKKLIHIEIMNERFDKLINLIDKENFQIVYDSIPEFLEKMENDTFRNNLEKLDSFNSFKLINKQLKQKFKHNEYNYFFQLLSFSISSAIINIELDSIKNFNFKSVDEKNFKNFNYNNFDFNSLNFNESNSDDLDFIVNGHTKTAFFDLITNYIDSMLILISNIYKIQLKNNFSEIITHFIFYLVDEEILLEQSEDIKLEKNNFKHLVRYEFSKRKNNFLIPLIVDDLSDNLGCLKEPFLLCNRYYSSKLIKKYEIIQILDYIFSIKPILKKNLNYGCKLDKNNFNTMSPLIKHSSLFSKNLQKETKTKTYIDHSKFLFLVNEFSQKNVSNLNLQSPIEEVFSYFNYYKDIKSKDNKVLLLNLFILLNYIIFNNKFKNSKYFYYSRFYDFRGRKYYNGIISITNMVHSRFFIFGGFYEISELKNLIDKTLDSKAYKVIMKTIDYKNDYNLYNINYNDKNLFNNIIKKTDLENYMIALNINLFISIGIEFKVELLKNENICKDGFTLNINDLYKEGVNKFKSLITSKPANLNTFSLKKNLVLSKYFNLLQMPWNFLKKDFISHDFGCSGHQLRHLYVGFAQKENYKYINISGDIEGVDTYSFMITKYFNFLKNLMNTNNNEFLSKKNKFNDEELNKQENRINEQLKIFKNELKKQFKNEKDLKNYKILFQRKFFKRSIMTTQYNVSLKNFHGYFWKNIKNENDAIINNFINENKSSTVLLINVFYYYCQHFNLLSDLELKKLDSYFFTSLEKSNFKIKFCDDFEVGYAYLEELKIDKRFIYWGKNKKRMTHSVSVKSGCINMKKTKSSLNPNLIHSIDSLITRLLNVYNDSIYSYHSIHDEFWLPFQESLIFKDLVNNVLKLDVHAQIKSSSKLNFKNHSKWFDQLEKEHFLFFSSSYNFLIIW